MALDGAKVNGNFITLGATTAIMDSGTTAILVSADDAAAIHSVTPLADAHLRMAAPDFAHTCTAHHLYWACSGVHRLQNLVADDASLPRSTAGGLGSS